MNREEINKLAAKLLEGSASREEEALLHQWYDAHHPDRDKSFLIHSAPSKEELSRRIQLAIEKETHPYPGLPLRRPVWPQIAAAVLVLALTTLGLYYLTRSPAIEWVTVSVPLGESRKVQLPDRSIAWVNAGSSIRYPEAFSAQKREVELINGQVFFEVQKNSDQPFYVQAGTLEVSVLGTTFDVKSYADEHVASVEVRSGRVEVRLPESEQREILNPGKMAIIQKGNSTIEIKDKESEYIGTWMDGRIAFYNEPIPMVLNTLERKYGVSIETDRSEWLESTLTIKLDKQPLGDVLEVLKYIFDFDYNILSSENSVQIMKK